MASVNRGISILLHALHAFELAADDASVDAETKAMLGLGAYDSIRVIANKWHAKADRGDKKRMADFAELDSWYRRWLSAARSVDHASLSKTIQEVEAAVAAKPRSV